MRFLRFVVKKASSRKNSSSGKKISSSAAVHVLTSKQENSKVTPGESNQFYYCCFSSSLAVVVVRSCIQSIQLLPFLLQSRSTLHTRSLPCLYTAVTLQVKDLSLFVPLSLSVYFFLGEMKRMK